MVAKLTAKYSKNVSLHATTKSLNCRLDQFLSFPKGFVLGLDIHFLAPLALERNGIKYFNGTTHN
jgi:arabinogalactan endo-1,4-beta-galactosidase